MEQLVVRPEREGINTLSGVKPQETWISCSEVEFNSHTTQTRVQKTIDQFRYSLKQ